MSKPESSISSAIRSLCMAALASAAGAAAGFGQVTLVGNSPFAPAAGSGAAGPAQAEAIELSGSSVQGSDVSVCIYERQAKRSQWIPVGGVCDGIHVISFDAAHDKAVVNVGGAFKELTLRKATFASTGPAPVARAAAPVSAQAAPLVQPAFPGPVASPAPAPPADAVTEQREARMLVSDLLEIGVQQRKAYQEARQKAASEPPAQPSN
jgi:hypothetical protein